MKTPKHYAVIGGGVSGMAAAHYLLRAGKAVDLFEASDRLGGRMAIDQFMGEEVCFGGKNIGYAYTEFRNFLEHYGDPSYGYFGINSARLIRGQPYSFKSEHKIRNALMLLQSGKLSDLVKLKRLMTQVKRNREQGDLNGLILKPSDNHSLHSLFSPKFSESIIRALTVRMNGAEPHEIAVENFGTHLQMLGDGYDQLNNPLSDIFNQFSKHPDLTIRYHQSVEGILRSETGYAIKVSGGQSTYDGVIIATPAHISASLCQAEFPNISEVLKTVRYFPVAVIIADYEENAFTPDIRAMVFGTDSPLSNIGAYGVSSLNRVRYTFSGKAARLLFDEKPSDDYLLTMAEAQARPYFNLSRNPCLGFKVKYWAKALCGYTNDEALFQTRLTTALQSATGLELAGDYRKGASIENCFRSAKSTVESLLEAETSSAQTSHKNASMEGYAHV